MDGFPLMTEAMTTIGPQGSIILQNGISLRECQTTGSTLEINTSFRDYFEDHDDVEDKNIQCVDTLGNPVESFESLEKMLLRIDTDGYVKKKILVEGGGHPLQEDCIVSIAYSAYWENVQESFDFVTIHKPLQLSLKESGLLPGLVTAIKSMLVGEFSLFLLSYKVMYGIMGVPPKIKPKADSVYYIQLIRSVLSPSDGAINYSEANIFNRVHKEVKYLYMSGVQFHNTQNYAPAIQCFKKAVAMLHKCRLADEAEEKVQEKLLLKLYMNMAVCFNKSMQPLKACTACNEIHRLSNIWNNGKALFQNAKALRMIGDFNQAQKKLTRAMKLCPESDDMMKEKELLIKSSESYNNSKIIGQKLTETMKDKISDEFKAEVETLIQKFKTDENICNLTLPGQLNALEVRYIKKTCEEYKVFCSKVEKKIALDKVENTPNCNKID